MYVIKFADGEVMELHVGAGKAGVGLPIKEVAELQADGDELEQVCTEVRNIPLAPRNRVMKWTGAIAQFIYDNVSF